MSPIKTSPFKDSPVFWIQKIPSNWETKPVKRVMSLVADSVGSEWTSTELLSLTQNGVIPRDMESGKGKFPADFSTYQLVCNDQLVMCLFDIDETPRTVGLARQSGMITGAYSVFSFIGDNNPGYFYYFFLWLDIGKALKPFYTGLRKVVRPGTFASLQVPVPPSHEQKIISIFLDSETAKIDALIAEQQRLIELLQEKRQAVISHAVTKGLNANAPMKDSGVEWLGEVPEHWQTQRLKNLFSLKHGYAFDGNRFSEEGKFALMTPGNFKETGGFRRKEPEKFYTGEDFPDDFILKTGQLLVVMTEQAPGLLGTSLVVPDNQCYLHNQRLGLVTGLNEEALDKDFLYWLTNSLVMKAKVGVTATGQKVRHTSPQKILELEVCLPPLVEQMLIAKTLSDSGERFEMLTATARDAIKLLSERRSALISAAVTGQIDVRGLVEAEAGEQ
jgi:type I restriction enzyme, S subunit